MNAMIYKTVLFVVYEKNAGRIEDRKENTYDWEAILLAKNVSTWRESSKFQIRFFLADFKFGGDIRRQLMAGFENEV